MKIIFLDIDGVLNHEIFYRARHERKNDAFEKDYPYSEIDPNSVALLSQLCEETGASIVVSSTWRHGRTIQELQDILKYFGCNANIIDVTPSLRKYEALRGNEILEWIKANEGLIGASYHDYTTYVILDDDSDMLYWQRDNFILVDRYCGITPQVCYKAKKILNGVKASVVI